MKPKTIKTLYWGFTIFFAMLMLMDGYGGLSRQEAGVEVMKHLGYPVYVLTIFGIAKVLGAIAILQNRYRTLKEWAYAGFTFNFIGAFLSRSFAGDHGAELVFPFIALAIMLVPYVLWKKHESVNQYTTVLN
jgi:hypothetical protein